MSDPQDAEDGTGVSFDPEGDGSEGRDEPKADRDADDADAVLPGEGDDAGLDDLSVDDIDGAD